MNKWYSNPGKVSGLLWFFLLATLFWTCNVDKVAGNGSETTNTVSLTGTVVDEEGNPKPGAGVFARSLSYFPDTSAGISFGEPFTPPDVYTDSSGKFTIEIRSSGELVVEVYSPSGGAMRRIDVLPEEVGFGLGTIQLNVPGNISGSIVKGEQGVGTVEGFNSAYISIAGMDRQVITDSLGGFIFENIPAGDYKLLITPRDPRFETITIKVDSVTSNDTTRIQNLYLNTFPDTGGQSELNAPTGFNLEDLPECGDSLLDNLSVTKYNPGERKYAGSPLLLCETPYGYTVGWGEFGNSQVHLTRLNKDGSVQEDDLIMEGKTPLGLVYHQGQYRVLVADTNNVLWLTGLRENGDLRFRHRLAGPAAQDEGFEASHIGNMNHLKVLGQGLAANGIIRKGSSYTDRMMFFDFGGNRLEGGWKTGCNNNDMGSRMAFQGDNMAMVCYGSQEKGKGLYYSIGPSLPGTVPNQLISKFSGNDLHLPSMSQVVAGANGDYWFVYVPDADSTDVNLVQLNSNGTFHSNALTHTPEIAESQARIGRFGNGFLVSWVEESKLVFQRLNHSGNRIGSPEKALFDFEKGIYARPGWNEMLHLSNGDVVWVYHAGEDIYISRIKACQ